MVHQCALQLADGNEDAAVDMGTLSGICSWSGRSEHRSWLCKLRRIRHMPAIDTVKQGGALNTREDGTAYVTYAYGPLTLRVSSRCCTVLGQV